MTEGFSQTWQAKVLSGPPMIAPARSFVLPQAVPGEEDALARGALWIEVTPRTGGTFLLQCALGFAGAGVATGVWTTPEPDVLLAVAGGYGYRVDTATPDRSSLLPLRPVVAVHDAAAANALVLLGFHELYILQPHRAWQSDRISWEGVAINSIAGETVEGTGWHLPSDRELPFALNLRTKELTGGAFNP
jgi:hypothetical protein